jgi:hypothetical protein
MKKILAWGFTLHAASMLLTTGMYYVMVYQCRRDRIREQRQRNL